jgi:pimeloyl-ACP methyl ester carboxylesterase
MYYRKILAMASGKDPDSATIQRAQRLRGNLGVRHPSGSYTVDGCSISWQELPAEPKSGQPVVCLHSIGSGSREFQPLINRIPAGSRLILLDWPGHGRSGDPPEGPSQKATENVPHSWFSVEHSAKLLDTVLNRLGITRPILLGCEFGAAVALHYAVSHPADVLGLVLCQPAGLIPPSAGSTLMKAASAAASLGMNNPARRQALRLQALKPAFFAADAEASLSLRASEAALRSALLSTACPILFALARNSRKYPLSKYPLKRYLALLNPALATAPRYRLTVFSGSFHPIWDEPERFAQALSGFIQAQLPLERHDHAWLLAAVDWPTRGMNHWKCVHPQCRAEQTLPEGQNANTPVS